MSTRATPLHGREVERLAGAAAGSRAFRAAVLERLRGWRPVPWYAWVLTDPVTTVGTDPLAEIPDLAELPRAVRLRYLSPPRWTGVDGARALGADAAGSRLHQELQRGHGVIDVVTVVFADDFGCWGFLDLWSPRPVSDGEVAALRSLAPSLTTALRRFQAAAFDGGAGPATGGGPVVLLLDDELRVTQQTPAADVALRALLGAPPDGSPVPAVAYNVAAQLLAREAGVDDHPPSGRVHLGRGSWLTARASRLEPGRSIAVSLEPSTPDERLDLFSRAHGLSSREREVLEHLARGADTRELAALMSISPHTVQDHLKSIFARTGCHTRRTLLARVLGAS